ncbi:MAG: M18 family aminopeptidase [Dorea sp.]|nr:M18 family aminopeptidase [Dorea sp.]
MEENSMSQTNLDREKNRETVHQLFDFITSSPSPFHAVWNMKQRLESEGYVQLLESQNWELKAGGKYYVIRNGSSILAFRIPKTDFQGFQIMASHSDSPSFKIKENPEMEVEGHYVKLNVEKYGGMLCAPWFDRPLSVAGRLVVREGNRLVTKLVSVERDLVLIPNLAIHMNREANDGYKYNAQKDLLPLYGMGCEKGTFLKQIAEAAGVHAEDIVGNDLFLYNRMEGSIWGAEEEFISIGKLDDLQCAFASLQAFLAAEDGESIPVHCVFDNEEVGSSTKQGAASTFLLDTLQRINECLGRTNGQYHQALASSFMLSADNAHAVHPNQADKTCPTNRPYPNGGVVIKYSANQKYTTDGMAAAIFTRICEEAEVPYQTFLNRSDLPGGSTLGNISNTQVALNTVDIGLAQLAMHSPYETGGVKDTDYLIRAAKKFYGTSVTEESEGVYQLW